VKKAFLPKKKPGGILGSRTFFVFVLSFVIIVVVKAFKFLFKFRNLKFPPEFFLSWFYIV